MPKFKIPAINSSEITPEPVYRARRRFMQGLGGAGIAGGLLTASPGLLAATLAPGKPLNDTAASDFSTDEELTPYKDITTYNNFYEFGTAKSDPARYSKDFKPWPWSVSIAGECDNPGDYNLEDFVKPHGLEERIYRLRCVEAWSMVIPWIGIPLGEVLKRFKPNSKAKYVAFTTVYRPEEMPGQRRSVLRWPYTEGLRIDEAMHPLTILAVGLYDELLPNQNGAPLRLVVPWKYGFKSIKSIVKIEFTETQPATAWNISAPNEYGFYSNVNPDVNHPRWSQARERRIGEFFKRETLPFNGYAEQVAGLYAGMDLQRHY
ncbi:MAG: protein-methionine-sulfoxide reductase catalytic subunit MsrP [Gammaproteobacteria bacterium]